MNNLILKGPLSRNLLFSVFTNGIITHTYERTPFSLSTSLRPDMLYPTFETIFLNSLGSDFIPILPFDCLHVMNVLGMSSFKDENINWLMNKTIRDSSYNHQYEYMNPLKEISDEAEVALPIHMTSHYSLTFKLKYPFENAYKYIDYFPAGPPKLIFKIKMKVLKCFIKMFIGYQNTDFLIKEFGKDIVDLLVPADRNPFEYDAITILKQEYGILKNDYFDCFYINKKEKAAKFNKLEEKINQIEQMNWSSITI